MNYYPPNALILPRINPSSSPEAQKMRIHQIQSTFKLNNPNIRTIQYSSPSGCPPIYYHNLHPYFLNYPQNLLCYRPIQYLVNPSIELNYIKNFQSQNISNGIPKNIDSFYPESAKIPMVSSISTTNLKKNQEVVNMQKKKEKKLELERKKKIKKRNEELKNLIRKIICFRDFILDLRSFSKSASILMDHKIVHIQRNKSNLKEIKIFMLKVLNNLEDFICKFLFDKKLTITSNDNGLKEDTIFIIKSFTHLILNNISNSFCNKEKLPKNIKEIFNSYIKEKSALPPFFLSTFEFNRLEFDINLRLRKMNLERQSLIVGFIIFYRILIIDILKNYISNFQKIKNLANEVPEVLDKKIKLKLMQIQEKERKKIWDLNMIDIMDDEKAKKNKNNTQEKMSAQREANIIRSLRTKEENAKIFNNRKKKEQIRQNLNYNINFLIQLLHYIFKSSFEKYTVMYRDYFQDRHIYGKLVYDEKENEKRQLTDASNTDAIEIMNNVFIPNDECDYFIIENGRWIYMNQLNTIKFCEEFVKLLTK